MVDELPGAREQLERDSAWLREQITELAAELTPEQIPDIIPREPSIVDWHEPLGFQYRVTERVQQPIERNTPGLLDRAAEFLAARGWQIERSETEAPGFAPMLYVTGTRGGFEIRVRIQPGYGGVLYTGETASRPLYEAEELVSPLPEKTAETVDPGYVLCSECNGLGWCSMCDGRGWIPDDERGRRGCHECHGTHFCPTCGGGGQLAATALAKGERKLYPELGNPSST